MKLLGRKIQSKVAVNPVLLSPFRKSLVAAFSMAAYMASHPYFLQRASTAALRALVIDLTEGMRRSLILSLKILHTSIMSIIGFFG